MSFRILLIEKDDGTRANWRELLQLFKYSVRAIGTLEGINTIRDVNAVGTKYFTSFDCVIGDTDAVGLDGLKLKGVLNNDFVRIPLILTSADNVPEWSLDRDELGLVAFLRKPFENSLLLEFVGKMEKVGRLLQENADTHKAIAKLLINQPNSVPTEIPLMRSYTLGRFRGSDEVHADIRLNSPSASRKHAFLVRIYKGRESYYKLIDFSSNGININGRRMPKMTRLNHKDEIEFYPGCKATYTEIAREDNDLDATLTSNDG